MSRVISLSVHDIVDAVLRTGSIDDRIFNSETMEEGSKVHRNVQSEQGVDYIPEYPLETLFTDRDLVLDIQGRADGLIKRADISGIDEIKSTVADLEIFCQNNFGWHQGQAKMYAWMYCRENRQDRMFVRVTYVRQRRESERMVKEEIFTFAELDAFARETIGRWLERYRAQGQHIAERDRSLKNLDFPFADYRPGQRDMEAFVERIAREGGRGYCRAPTGIGKTICALLPSLKSLSEDEGPERIYYLTSKGSIRRQALLTSRIMHEHGARFRTVAFTAKDRICLNTPELKGRCNPRECVYAQDYYSKLYDVLTTTLSERDTFDMDDILDLAIRFTVCPFQLQMDLALLSDLIVCDYNYVFDPQVRDPDTERTSRIDSAILVDEAHNLPGRAREMYSARIRPAELAQVIPELKGRQYSRTRRALRACLDSLDSIRPESDEGREMIIEAVPSDILLAIRDVQSAIADDTRGESAPPPRPLVELRQTLKSFMSCPVDGDERYAIYYTFQGGKLESLVCRCLDASSMIRDTADKYDYSVFFSATLSPLDYCVSQLGGEGTPPEDILDLPSPFPSENRLILVDVGPDIRYRSRESSVGRVVDSLISMIEAKVGNYIIYLPSFAYMDMLLPAFRGVFDGVITVQTRDMTAADRDDFISSFHRNPEVTHVGFCVLGGVFGEGIELEEGALSGVAIVSVGLPGIGFDNMLLKDYYDRSGKNGFDYAYRYPGFNRVVQAAGRVIRRAEDRGVILLVDSRYYTSGYGIMLRDALGRTEMVRTPERVAARCRAFWHRAEKSGGEE